MRWKAAATIAAAAAPAALTRVVHMPTLHVCAHLPLSPHLFVLALVFACPRLLLPLFMLVPARSCLLSCVLVSTGPHYLVALVWPSFGLIWAHLCWSPLPGHTHLAFICVLSCLFVLVCAHLQWPLFLLGYVLICAGPRYLVTLIQPSFVLVCACLCLFVCIKYIVSKHMIIKKNSPLW